MFPSTVGEKTDRRVTVYGFSGTVLAVEKVGVESLEEVVEHFKKQRRVRAISVVWVELLDIYSNYQFTSPRYLNWERDDTLPGLNAWYRTDNVELCRGCPAIDQDPETAIRRFRAECDANDEKVKKYQEKNHSQYLQHTHPDVSIEPIKKLSKEDA